MRRAVLSAWLGVPESGVRFSRGERGKPFLPDCPHVHFNVSHSGSLYAVAVSEACEVGVDVERVRDVPEKRDIAQRYGLDELHFFEDWSRREAYLKALGVGVFGMEDPADPAIHVESFSVAEGYFGAWASTCGPLEPVIHRSLYAISFHPAQKTAINSAVADILIRKIAPEWFLVLAQTEVGSRWLAVRSGSGEHSGPDACEIYGEAVKSGLNVEFEPDNIRW